MTTEAATTDPNPPVDPAVAAAAAAAGANASTDAPAATDATAAPAAGDPPAADPAAGDPAASADPKPHGNKGRSPWYNQRIAEEAEGRRQEAEARRSAEERASNLQAMLERLQKGGTVDPAAATTSRIDESALEPRARQIAQEIINTNTVRSVVGAGIAKFDDWDDRMGTLAAAIGDANTQPFALDVHSVDPANAHIILHQLADDPQKAARLAKMTTRDRTIELVKMSMAASQTETKPAADPKPPAPPRSVSKAPAPPPPVEPGASQVVDWRSDKASDADFSRGWEENARKRSIRK